MLQSADIASPHHVSFVIPILHCFEFTALYYKTAKSPSHSDQRLLFTHWVVCIEGHSKSPQTGKEFFLDISEKKLGHESLVILNI